LLDFWRRIYSGNGRRVLITEMIPRQGAAASESPPLQTGYGSKEFPTEGFVLGVDDIEEFRSTREKLVYDEETDFPDYAKSTFQTAVEGGQEMLTSVVSQ
jgi:hypothetical protein